VEEVRPKVALARTLLRAAEVDWSVDDPRHREPLNSIKNTTRHTHGTHDTRVVRTVDCVALVLHEQRGLQDLLGVVTTKLRRACAVCVCGENEVRPAQKVKEGSWGGVVPGR
jgi:hypothetical protein